MHDPYELEIRARCPRAALIYDHFHVIKPLSMAIDDIRRRLQRELPPLGVCTSKAVGTCSCATART